MTYISFYFHFFISLFLVMGLQNCTTNVVSLQEVDLVSPSIKNPIKIVDNKENKSIDLNINFSVNNKNKFEGKLDGHTKVNSNNIFQLEPVENEDYFLEYPDVNNLEFSGNNYSWITPTLAASFAFDYVLVQNVALTIGASISSYKDNILPGYNFGLGFFAEGESMAFRVDGFVRAQRILHDITYIRAEDISLNENPFRKVHVFNEVERETYYNFGALLSTNTKLEHWPINLFANYSFGWQTFYDINPRASFFDEEIGNFEHAEYYHSFTFGVFQNVFENSRIMIGYNFAVYQHSSKDFIVPNIVVQYDILF